MLHLGAWARAYFTWVIDEQLGWGAVFFIAGFMGWPAILRVVVGGRMVLGGC